MILIGTACLLFHDYTYIRVLSDTMVELGKRDGTRLTVDI